MRVPVITARQQLESNLASAQERLRKSPHSVRLKEDVAIALLQLKGIK